MKPRILCSLVLALVLARPVAAAETVRVANAAPTSFFYTALAIGAQKGIFAADGVAVHDIQVFGGARGQFALAANSVDIDLGAGPELASIEKGKVAIGVAEVTDKAGLIVAVVNPDGPKTIADLKGKSLGVSTAASLTDWLVHELSRRQGWGPAGIRSVPLGGEGGLLAALRTHAIDGALVDLGTGYRLEASGRGRILVRFGQVVPDVILHVIYARRDFAAQHPGAVRAFLKGWFDTVAYMKTHKQESVAIAATQLKLPPDIASRVYDELMPTMSTDGKFSKAGFAALARSFVEMGTLKSEPDMATLVTEKYLPSTP